MFDVNRWLKDGADALKSSAQNQVQHAVEDLLASSLTPDRLMRLLAILSNKGIDLSQLAGMADKPDGFDPYEVLGLERSVSDENIKSRYRELLKELHPDTARIEGTEFLLQLVISSYTQIAMERGWK